MSPSELADLLKTSDEAFRLTLSSGSDGSWTIRNAPSLKGCLFMWGNPTILNPGLPSASESFQFKHCIG